MIIKFRVMVMLNLCPLLFCIASIVTGTENKLLALMLQLLLVWENYMFTQHVKKMLILDALSFVVTAGGSILVNVVYFHRTEKVLSDMSVLYYAGHIVWVIVSLLLTLGMLTYAFHQQKNRKLESVTAGILGVALVICTFWGYGFIKPDPYSNVSVETDPDQSIACDDRYEAEITWGEEDEYDSEERVVIRDRDGEKISQITTKKLGDIEPQLVALGEEHYYVYGESDDWEDEDEDEEQYYLIQLTYQSEIVAKYEMPQLYALACRNGYVFICDDIGIWADVNIAGGFYANRYMEESNFGNGEFVDCESDGTGKCQVGGITLYEHEKVYFSMNPEIDGYPEYFIWSPHEWGKGEQTKWKRAVRNLLREKGLGEEEVWERQYGTKTYGVINTKTSIMPGLPYNKAKALAYRMDIQTAQIEWVGEWDGVYLVLHEENYVVYQDGRTLYVENTQTGEREKLCRVRKDREQEYEIYGDYLHVTNFSSYDSGEWVKWKK